MLLGVDLGTTHTVAVLFDEGGAGLGVPLLFDASPLLLSAVHLASDGQLLTGRDAARGALHDPARSEPNPKLRIDDGTVLLGDAQLPVQSLLAAPLRRVLAEATRHAGAAPSGTVLTFPASWAARRRDVLLRAAEEAGLPGVTLVPEPVAAAAFHARTFGRPASAGAFIVVYDLGGGTFDVTVLRHVADGWQVVASAGLDDVGGIDLDAALVEHLGRTVGAREPRRWRRLLEPVDPTSRRVLQGFRDDVRGAKEQLSRTASTTVRVPGYEVEAYLSRDELDTVAAPLLTRTVDLVETVLRRAGLNPRDLATVFLVGGSSRIPLVATLLHRRFGVAPTLVDQPELVVASGSALAAGVPPVTAEAVVDREPGHAAAPPPPAPAAIWEHTAGPVSAPPMSVPPASASPISAPPISVPPVSAPPMVEPPASVPSAAVPPPSAARRQGALLAAAIVVLLAVGFVAWQPWRHRANTDLGAGHSPGPGTSTAAHDTRGRTVHINKSAWYAGFSLHFVDAVYDPTKEDGELTVTAQATNLGPTDEALLDIEFPVSVRFGTRPYKGSYQGATVTVPHGSTVDVSIGYNLVDSVDPATGVLVVGDNDRLKAVVPITGTDGQITLEPKPLFGPISADLRLLSYTNVSCTLRPDLTRRYAQAQEHDRVVGCVYDIALKGSATGVGIDAEMFRLVLPDGTETSPTDQPNQTLKTDGQIRAQWVDFEIADPAPGAYKLRLRYRDIFNKNANADRDLPFTILPT